MQRFLILVSLTIIALLSGCTSQAISDADRSRIKSVTFNSKIETAPLDYHTLGTVIQTTPIIVNSGGVIMAIAPNNFGGNPELIEGKKITDFMASHGIRIEDIVHDEFIQQWNSRHIFSLVDKDGDAEVTLKIWYYMLASPNPLSSALRPGIGVDAVINDKTGNEIWKQRSIIKVFASSVPKHTWEEMEANPSLFKEACEREAQMAVKELLDDLEKP
jgi:hypothetical protein